MLFALVCLTPYAIRVSLSNRIDSNTLLTDRGFMNRGCTSKEHTRFIQRNLKWKCVLAQPMSQKVKSRRR